MCNRVSFRRFVGSLLEKSRNFLVRPRACRLFRQSSSVSGRGEKIRNLLPTVVWNWPRNVRFFFKVSIQCVFGVCIRNRAPCRGTTVGRCLPNQPERKVKNVRSRIVWRRCILPGKPELLTFAVHATRWKNNNVNYVNYSIWKESNRKFKIRPRRQGRAMRWFRSKLQYTRL